MKLCNAEKKTYLVQEVTPNKLTNASEGVIVSGCEKSITVEEMAQLLRNNGVDIGEIRLYQWLRAEGYAYRQPCGRNMPTQKSLEYGVLEVRKRLYQYADGRQIGGSYTLAVTPKGQEYFMLILGDRQTGCKPAANRKPKQAA